LGRNIRNGDFSITSSWVFCHSAIPKQFENDSFHYIHTPARYWWNPEVDTRTQLKIPAYVILFLRFIDKWLARNHLNVLANSQSTRERVLKFWHLESDVIHPPVDVDFYDFSKVENIGPRGEFLLCVGRFVPYKGHHLVIQVGESLNLPVVLVGHGEGEAYLRRLAQNSSTKVSLIVNASRETIRELYATCACLVYPAIEDFGIVPVEAMGTGALVLGINEGGLIDSVVQGENGFLVPRMALSALVEGFRGLPEKSRESVRETSLQFSQEFFVSNVRAYLKKIQIR
jgi:glycosyltransferase involved in cell wall biosynthesis